MCVRTYSQEEKLAYLEEFKSSGENLSKYALEKGIPETTLRGWVKEDKNLTFGAIEIKTSNPTSPKIIKAPTVFATDNIRIELKDGFNKELLKRIIEVLINDK